MVHRSGIMHDDRFTAPGRRDASAVPIQPGSAPPSPSAGAPAPPTPAQPANAWWLPAPPDPRPPSAPIPGWTPPTPGWATPRPSRGRGLLIATAAVLAVLVVFSLGVSLGQAGFGSAAGSSPSYSPSAGAPDWRLLDEAYSLLEQHYVDPAALDPLTLERGAIAGMTASLDDRGHTGYLTPDEVKARDDSLSGTFVGVGAVLDQQDGAVRIVRVLRDSPAERAGLQVGDQIITVDGASVADLTLDEVVSKVRGIEGTTVTLELRSPDGDVSDPHDHPGEARPAAGVVGVRAGHEERRAAARVLLRGRREGDDGRAPRGARPGGPGDRPRPARQPRGLRQRAGRGRQPVPLQRRRLPLRGPQRHADAPRREAGRDRHRTSRSSCSSTARPPARRRS